MTCRLHKSILFPRGAAGTPLCPEKQRNRSKGQGFRRAVRKDKSLALIDALDTEHARNALHVLEYPFQLIAIGNIHGGLNARL